MVKTCSRLVLTGFCFPGLHRIAFKRTAMLVIPRLDEVQERILELIQENKDDEFTQLNTIILEFFPPPPVDPNEFLPNHDYFMKAHLQLQTLANQGFIDLYNPQFESDGYLHLLNPIFITAQGLGYLQTKDLVTQIITQAVEKLSLPEPEKQTLLKKALASAKDLGLDLLVKYTSQALLG